MNRIRRKRLAWTLAVVCAICAAAAPFTALATLVGSCPHFSIGAAKGAFGISYPYSPPWSIDLDWHFDGWDNPRYAFMPTFRRFSSGFELTIPIWMTVAASGVLSLVMFRRSKTPEGHCKRCGYNLTGNVSGRCPECGHAV